MMENTFIELTETVNQKTTYCRCCLTFYDEDSMDNIFECLFQDVELHEIINILAPVSIIFDDGYSQFICENCKESAIGAFYFRQKCIKSNEQILSQGHVMVFDEETFMQENMSEQDDEAILSSSMIRLGDDEIAVETSIHCELCKDIFKSHQDLNIHMEDVHKVSYQFIEENLVLESHFCSICGDEYKSQDELDVHKKSHYSYENEEEQEKSTDVTTVKPGQTRKRECDICLKKFETPSKLNRHLYVHRDVIDVSSLPPLPKIKKKHQCNICEKKVDTPSKLQRHLRVHEKDSKLYNGINQHRPHPCSECSQRFWDETKLERHKLIHSDAFIRSKIPLPDDHLFTCVVCLQKIPNYENCLQHMRNHREEFGDNTEVCCKLCPKVYPKLVNLVRHARVHPENATHQCIYCDKLMGMGDDLIEHMLRHEGFKPFVCNVESCGKSFLKSHKLKQHMETHNGQEVAKFCCDKCDKSFSNIEYLKRHLIRHSGRKDHACNLCSMRFTFKAGLTSHMTSHTKEKPFNCDICSSPFSKLSALRTHQRAHAGDKRFACEICKMEFVTSSHLRRHMLTHTKIKPYHCSYCEKAYAQSNDLKKHLRIHLGPNIFKCDFDDCLEAFPKSLQLKNHKMMHYSSASGLFTEESYVDDIKTMKLL